ncbi:unnamed protein product [Allacma fusca]|uniref:Peptidase S8/S53 domain-containing protein n=1 Tax=Allacma fusca TaxID=39272 RepID=A0A8J2PM87_9HEXA|nr:unnamed protein product [Allacma fusca]
MIKLVLAIILAGLVREALVAPTIDLQLMNTLRQGHTANILITLKESSGPTLNQIKDLKFQNRGQKLYEAAEALKSFTANSQKNVLQLLSQYQQTNSLKINTFWITNQIGVKGVDLQIVQDLGKFAEISKIEEEFFIAIDSPIDLTVIDNLQDNEEEFQWGVEQIQAPQVWSSGNKGEGIIVGTVDTGVRYTHEALRGNFAGEYGWFDPTVGILTPYDPNGHGTHTTANIVGRARNEGVAPGAQWTSCKGCSMQQCSQIDLISCGHFMACPTLANGSYANCEKAPQVVSNSWSGNQAYLWYYDIIEYYHFVGIIPVFSIGNSGPACGTANSPGDYDNVIGVGATTIDNKLLNFSSVGPAAIASKIKPDVAAPGAKIFSAWHTSDSAYATLSGTSMACPHVAGVVALLLAEHPNMNYNQVKGALQGGSVPTAGTGKDCGKIPEGTYPNHHVGYGRINALNSIRAARAML